MVEKRRHFLFGKRNKQFCKTICVYGSTFLSLKCWYLWFFCNEEKSAISLYTNTANGHLEWWRKAIVATIHQNYYEINQSVKSLFYKTDFRMDLVLNVSEDRVSNDCSQLDWFQSRLSGYWHGCCCCFSVIVAHNYGENQISAKKNTIHIKQLWFCGWYTSGSASWKPHNHIQRIATTLMRYRANIFIHANMLPGLSLSFCVWLSSKHWLSLCAHISLSTLFAITVNGISLAVYRIVCIDSIYRFLSPLSQTRFFSIAVGFFISTR